MHVITWLLNYAPGRLGGTESYLLELIDQFAHHVNEAQFVYVTPRDVDFVDVLAETIPVKRVKQPTTGLRKATNYVSSLSYDIDSVAPSASGVVNFFPLTATMPRPKAHSRSVITIHDLQHLELPANFGFAQKLFRGLTYTRRHEGIVRYVAVSEYSRQSILERMKVAPESVSVIYPGIDSEFFKPGTPDAHIAQLGDYVFYPARPLAHKNHAALFDAIAALREQHPQLRLVLSGSDGELLGSLPDFVRHVGHVSKTELRNLYRGARAVVYPSLFEGFGFPPLEAMACGIPAVVSRAGSLPEVCGDAAIFVNPESVTDIATGIDEALRNGDRYVARGLAHAQQYTWERTANEYMALFSEMVTAPH